MSVRFVAMGDSFTEGVGDDAPDAPNGLRGWADRVAEQLAARDPGLRYANLAVRGKLLGKVLDEQLEPALAMRPNLITLYAGGNDLMRPKVDIDALADSYDDAVGRLAASGAAVVVFTGVDGVEDPVFRQMRGRTAIYNEHVRVLARRHGARLVDMWAMRGLRDPRLWSADRIHLNAAGHTVVAAEVLNVIGEAHSIVPADLGPRVKLDRRTRQAQRVEWTRRYAVPWVKRRLRGESSGDLVTPKRPTLLPVDAPAG